MFSNKNLNLASTIAELPSLVENLLLLLSDKEKEVIKRRFNLLGQSKSTLEEIGQSFAVTRERVRQIEKTALFKMRRNVFNTSLKSLHEFASNILREHGGIIKEKVFTENLKSNLPPQFKIDENSLHLSLVLHDNLECIGNTINFYPYVKEKTISDYSLKYVSDNIINYLNKNGNVKKIDKIYSEMENVVKESNFDISKMRSLIEIDKRISVLDNELIGLLEWRHIYPRTLRDKILYILRREKMPLHFSKITEYIITAKFDTRSVNIQAVHNELIRHNQFILIGRGIYALQEWGYESGTVSYVIEKILKDRKELSQDEIVNLVLKERQVKKITILLALKNNTKFERIGRKIYKLTKS